jgi:hypothetical protein
VKVERCRLKINLRVRATNAEVVAVYRTFGHGLEQRASIGKRVSHEI